jgi:cytochrome c-type biogenesis protein CcmE
MTDLSPRPTAPVRRRRRLVPMLVLAAVLIAGGVILTQFLTSAVDYYCNADEIGVRSGCDTDRRLRIQGTVDAGSVGLDRGVTEFTITFNEATVPVRYDGEPGGIFKECIPVVVHGQFDDDGAVVFLGDRVEVKHSNEYVAVNSDRLDQDEYGGDCPADDA